MLGLCIVYFKYIPHFKFYCNFWIHSFTIKCCFFCITVDLRRPFRRLLKPHCALTFYVMSSNIKRHEIWLTTIALWSCGAYLKQRTRPFRDQVMISCLCHVKPLLYNQDWLILQFHLEEDILQILLNESNDKKAVCKMVAFINNLRRSNDECQNNFFAFTMPFH